jgi:hypothetical protein
MMALLPPVGWADVATKHDLDQAVALVDQKIDATKRELEGKMATLEGKIEAGLARVRGEIAESRTAAERLARTQTQRFYAALLVVLAILVPLIVYHYAVRALRAPEAALAPDGGDMATGRMFAMPVTAVSMIVGIIAAFAVPLYC